MGTIICHLGSGNVIGIPLDECLVCGKKSTNRHHVIPLAFKPKMNVTIPLCDEHKDLLHPTLKTFYFPKKLRNKFGKAKKHTEDVMAILKSIETNLQFHKKNHAQLLPSNGDKT